MHSQNSSSSQQGIIHSNLVTVKCNAFKDHGRKLAQFCSLNAQSARNKTHQIVDYLIENELSLCAITETWLTPEDDVAMGELEPDGYKFDPIHRHNKRGGGIAIIHQQTLKAKVSNAGYYSSYQYMEMIIPKGSDSVKLLVIYRPPYNAKSNPIPETTFFREFSEHMESVLLTPSMLCITGDFNFHMDLLGVEVDTLTDSAKRQKQIATQFHDLVTSMGLVQHITEATHEDGHTLDLLITRSTDSVLHGMPVVDCLFSDVFRS